jgi:fucose permease
MIIPELNETARMKHALRSKILLLVIYLSFISIGLPDGVLGVAWPLMQVQFNQPIEAASWIVLIVLPLSALSSIMATRVGSKIGYGTVTTGSALLTAASLIGIGWSNSFGGLVLFSLGLGIGQGAVDALLNDYVAKHYSARHMSWLHGFWGVGATFGPTLMAITLASQTVWNQGYFRLGALQLVIALILGLSITLWDTSSAVPHHTKKQAGRFKPRMLYGMAFYFLYVGAELGIGLWTSTAFVVGRAMSPAQAGAYVGLYYGSIMAGRFLIGAIANRIGQHTLIRGGLVLSGLGVLGLIVLKHPILLGIALSMVGLGFAPLYPAMMHETPKRYTPQDAGLAVGLQIGFSYLGGTLITNLLGRLMDLGLVSWLYPAALSLIVMMMLVAESYRKASQIAQQRNML